MVPLSDILRSDMFNIVQQNWRIVTAEMQGPLRSRHAASGAVPKGWLIEKRILRRRSSGTSLVLLNPSPWSGSRSFPDGKRRRAHSAGAFNGPNFLMGTKLNNSEFEDRTRISSAAVRTYDVNFANNLWRADARRETSWRRAELKARLYQ